MKAFLISAFAAALALAAAADPTTAPETTAPVAPVTTTTAPAATVASGNKSPSDLPESAPTTTNGEYHMTPVRSIQARVQSDKPVWNDDNKRFVSSFYKGFPEAYRAVMDTVNTASVEGALMYVQAEGIDYNKRSEELRCWRKTNMTYVVFYDITFAQTNETLAEYQDTTSLNEYGPMIAMDSGRCTPVDNETLPDVCYMFNGEKGFANVGPFVGGESKEASDRAPYPNNVWFSFPNTCPTKVWKEKTEECRNATRKGLCDFGVKPNGVDCTFSYEILGFIALDDVIGITSMVNNQTQQPYKNFHEFCEAGGVEFTTANGGESIPFWENPLNTTANAERAQKLIDAYQNLASGQGNSSIIDQADVEKFKPLPQLEELAKANPPCFKNVAKCNTGSCHRTNYAQICKECTNGEQDCQKSTDGFKFPTLTKAVGEKALVNSSNSSSSSEGSSVGGTAGKDSAKKNADGTTGSSDAFSHKLQLASALACLLIAAIVV